MIVLGRWENEDEDPKKLAEFLKEKTGKEPGWGDGNPVVPGEDVAVLYRLGQELKCRVRGA